MKIDHNLYQNNETKNTEWERIFYFSLNVKCKDKTLEWKQMWKKHSSLKLCKLI